MIKKTISTILALLMICSPALAEVFTGTTVARSTMNITAQAGGIIDELYVQPGSVVKEGEVIARLRTTKVFATQNGTVARIQAKEGKKNTGDCSGNYPRIPLHHSLYFRQRIRFHFFQSCALRRNPVYEVHCQRYPPGHRQALQHRWLHLYVGSHRRRILCG